jgi:hypothetical protein
MSMQLSTGVSSLISLGLSIGDVAVLASLGKKLGNWLTADSDGTLLLDLLGLDELDIFKRRGLMEYTRFNKRWRSAFVIQVNGRVETFLSEHAEKVLEDLRPFTAVMVCLTAALEAFVGRKGVRDTLKRVLVGLFSVLDFGDETVKSQLSALHSGWLSTADVRRMTGEAREIRTDLIRRGVILDGLMHPDDAPLMAQFLLWLLKGDEETFTTSSSDIAGVAFCLRELGIDILSTEGLMGMAIPTSCRLIYSREAIIERPGHDIRQSPSRVRVMSTTVNLVNPEESLTIFPMESKDVGNQCRMAWEEGVKAAKGIVCGLIPFDPTSSQDMVYAFVNQGTEPGRAKNPDIYKIASIQFFGVNQELLSGLLLIFQHQDSATLDWLHSQVLGGPATISGVQSALRNPIDVFTVFQAFVMGYYYDIFLRLVDTSMLQLRTVEGSWGFRSLEFLERMRDQFLRDKTISPGTKALTRGEVIYILSMLLCNAESDSTHIYPDHSGSRNHCIGFVGKRTLLAKSLVSPCRTLRDVGNFVLFDCDASGIPRDKYGFVRPGVSVTDVNTPHGIDTESVAEDVTFHIQPDWDANEETLLLCIRYKGRRVADIDPWLADARFCFSLIRPVMEARAHETETFNWTATDLLALKPIPVDQSLPIVIQVKDRPRLQYAATVLYSSAVVKVATNCTETAIKAAAEEATLRMRPVCIIVLVDELQCQAKPEDWCYLPYPTAGHDQHQVEQLDKRHAARGTFGAEGWRNPQDA